MGPLIGTADGVYDLTGGSVLAGQQVRHLRRFEDTWWAVDDTGNVWHESDGIASAPPGVSFTCLQPAPDRVWLGADAARLYVLEDGQIVQDERFADSPGRDAWHTPWGGPPDIRSMALGSDGVLYVNVHVGGILRYDATGPTPTLDIDSDVHQVTAHPRRALVVAATARGLAVAVDGRHFEFRSEGLEHLYCRAVAVDDESVLVSASRGPRGTAAQLYRGSLDGGFLERCRSGLPDEFTGNIDTHCLLATDEGWFVGNGGTVWSSEDGGTTWGIAIGDLAPITCLA